ncbi:hypothetical protein BRD04_02475 [Halobacteriales archaeon QS_9_67_17]|nr:MAG: hypothetical protein BRD04_02475 [Halobacteriales archaeon QS_9_67_17]
MATTVDPRKPLGIVLLVIGLGLGLAQLSTFPGMLFGGCTEVNAQDGDGQGIGIIGVEGTTLLYTPDGVNECRIPLPAVLAPIGLTTAGGGLLLSAR